MTKNKSVEEESVEYLCQDQERRMKGKTIYER
jgi:hypothetical protein